MSSPKNTLAIVYDFDGTLSPGNMQETTIFDHYGIKKDEFWARSQKLVSDKGFERTLAYLYLLMEDEAFRKKPLTPELMKDLARNICYFPGVESYFGEIDEYVASIPDAAELGIKVQHFIVSSGLSEIVSHCSIAKYFRKIYACEFAHENGRPVFPKLVINDTNKTQFLFRINKGKLEMRDDINSHVPDVEKPIPFRNIIYIGDGHTDIPSMTVTQRYGGHAIAVYPPSETVPKEIKEMVHAERAAHFAPADYSKDKLLVKIIRRAIRKIIADISYRSSAERSLDWIRNNP